MLTVGAVTESVEVVADAPLLEPTTSAVGKVVDNRRIQDLPLNTRNVYALVTLTPGIAGRFGQQFDDAVQWSVYGTRNATMDILVDGATATHPSTNGFTGITVFPSVDAIQEFKVMGANVPAEYGRTTGTVLNVVYKSGSNAFHGSVYDFLRNSVFDSNNFFANQRGEDLASFKRNQFGGTLAGPVRKDKTFFMVSYEGLRERSLTSRLYTLPTLLERGGDFSQTMDSKGAQVKIYDPFSTRPDGSGAFIRDAFPGNFIPVNRQDVVGRNAVKYYPQPNQPGDPFTQRNNYGISGSSNTNLDNADFRLDHNLSNTRKVFARYSNRYTEAKPPILFPGETAIAEGRLNEISRGRNFVSEYSDAVSASSVFTARLNMNRTVYDYQNQGIGFLPSSLGLPKSIDTVADLTMFPTFGPSGYQQLGHRDHRHSAFNSYTASANLKHLRGSHSMTFGFEGRMFRNNVNEARAPSGDFTFSTAFTQGPNPVRASSTAGNSIASMLLGTGVTGNRLFLKYKDVAAQSIYYAGYVQDDWRLTPKLTFNLGLRWDMDTPRTERYNRLNYFDPNVPSPLAKTVAGFPDLKGGLVYMGVDGNSRSQFAWDKHNFAPRFGMAYQFTPRTVFRGGYAHIYSASFKQASGTDTAYGFRGETPYVSTVDDITPLNLLSNPFPNGFQTPLGAAERLLSGVGQTIRPQFHDDGVPWTQQWNATLQHELPGQTMIEVGYVATRGHNLAYERFDNQLDPKYLSLGNKLKETVANPFFGMANAGILTAAKVTRAQLLRPFPQFDGLEGTRNPGGMSWYNALIVSVKKRLAHGVQFEGSYTWSKSIDVGEAKLQNNYDLLSQRCVSNLDIPHRVVFSYIYELPFGRAQRFGRNAHKAVDWIIGGWQLNGITTLQTGAPVAITASSTAGIFGAAQYANNNGKSGQLEGKAQQRLDRWFDTSVFSQPEPYTFGNLSRNLNDVRTDGVQNFDLSLFKAFKPHEKVTVQFRTEALNAFNTPQFGGPNAGVTSSSFGRVSSQSNSPRQIQFGLKVLW